MEEKIITKEANLHDLVAIAKENAENIAYQKKAQFARAIHAVVEAVFRGEIDSVDISRYKESPTFYIFNNGHVTSTAYGIEDVERVICEAIGAEKTEEAAQ